MVLFDFQITFPLLVLDYLARSCTKILRPKILERTKQSWVLLHEYAVLLIVLEF